MGRDRQDDELQHRFARNQRAARQRAGLTQVSLAAQLGMKDEVYARYERAKMWPSLGKLGQLSRILDCSIDSLLGLSKSTSRASRPPPADDAPPAVRRLLRQIRKAQPGTVLLIAEVLRELENAAAGNGRSGKGGKGGKGGKRGKGGVATGAPTAANDAM